MMQGPFAWRCARARVAPFCSVPRMAAPPPGFEQRVRTAAQRLWRARAWRSRSSRTAPDPGPRLGRSRDRHDRPVDADTIFATGSTGKAFTAAALAVLVDQGKIKWDDKVIDHMPYFRMYDPWVTREMTIRDLLVHRSGLGLGAGDLLFVPNSDRSRKDVTLALRHIKPATSFRSAYAYDNVLYIVAGQLIEEVSGMSWEQFVARHIYQPLAMNNSTVSDSELLASPNRAEPHARIDGPRARPWHASEARRRHQHLARSRRPRAGLRSAPTT